jgi:hypothetical protein
MDARQRASQVRRRVAHSAQKCHHCGHPYQPENVTVLGRESDVWFLTLRCRRCRRRIFAAATFRERPARANDRASVAARGDAQPRISADDVAAMRSFLRDFDGDFRKLFQSS